MPDMTSVADTSGMIPADQADDGLHPNALGYRMIAPVALAAIDKALVAAPAAPEAPARRRFSLGK